MARRILIADDSVTIQQAFAMTFGAEDVAVDAVGDAGSIVAKAQANRPDLVVLDGRLANASGLDVCRDLLSTAGMGDLKVYILGSVKHPVDLAAAKAVGAQGCFEKPWDTAKMIKAVEDALDTPRGCPGASA